MVDTIVMRHITGNVKIFLQKSPSTTSENVKLQKLTQSIRMVIINYIMEVRGYGR